MPPGWSHTGDHKMTTVVKKAYFESLGEGVEREKKNARQGEKEEVV
jgi:hypothetical protein